MKRAGEEEPAQHQTMSGGRSLFQALISERTRVASAEEVRSAEMKWNLWDFRIAPAYSIGRLGLLYRGVRGVPRCVVELPRGAERFEL